MRPPEHKFKITFRDRSTQEVEADGYYEDKSLIIFSRYENGGDTKVLSFPVSDLGSIAVDGVADRAEARKTNATMHAAASQRIGPSIRR